MQTAATRVTSALLVAGAIALTGCGGNAAPHATTPNELTPAQIDADPLALLPPAAFAVATVDAHAFYASDSVGAQLAALSEKLVPIGEEAGFKASRDDDRFVVGAYSSAGLDVAAVVSGRFDEAKIRDAAEAHTQTHTGGLIAKSTYAGRSVYTVADLGFAVLTPRTALAGTQTGIRCALDRIRDGQPKRDIPAWVQETIDTPNATATLSADLTQPAAAAAIASFPVRWSKGAERARVVARLEPLGVRVTGTIAYADPASASAGGSALQQAATMANLVAITGLTPRLDDLSIGAEGADVRCSFAIDDRSLGTLAGLIQKYAR